MSGWIEGWMKIKLIDFHRLDFLFERSSCLPRTRSLPPLSVVLSSVHILDVILIVLILMLMTNSLSQSEEKVSDSRKPVLLFCFLHSDKNTIPVMPFDESCWWVMMLMKLRSAGRTPGHKSPKIGAEGEPLEPENMSSSAFCLNEGSETSSKPKLGKEGSEEGKESRRGNHDRIIKESRLIPILERWAAKAALNGLLRRKKTYASWFIHSLLSLSRSLSLSPSSLPQDCLSSARLKNFYLTDFILIIITDWHTKSLLCISIPSLLYSSVTHKEDLLIARILQNMRLQLRTVLK